MILVMQNVNKTYHLNNNDNNNNYNNVIHNISHIAVKVQCTSSKAILCDYCRGSQVSFPPTACAKKSNNPVVHLHRG